MQQIDAEAVVRGPFEALELQVEVDRAEAMLTEAIQTPYQPHATTMLRKRANASLADGRDDEATIARVGLVWDDLDRVRPWEAGFALHEGRAPVFNWPCRLSLDGSLKSTDSLLDWILLHGCWE